MSRVTYDAGTMTITVDGLEDVERALGDLKKKTPAAAKVAINATARQARKLMVAQAKARYAVNAAGRRHLKDLVQRKKATNTSLSAELHIEKMRNDLGYFQHRPTESFKGRDVLRRAPAHVKARVLKSSAMTALTGDGANLSKGFLVEFKSGHVGMVQRRIGSSSSHTVTERGRPRWRNKDGKVEKLVTMGSPSATAMHSTVWPYVEPEVTEYLYDEGGAREGYQDVANIKEDIVQRVCTRPYFGGAFTILKPVVWAMQQDDTHPYYFGACTLTCTAPAMTQDTELEGLV